MDIHSLPAYGAISLGLLTSISPCPLATNIAAVAFVSRRYQALKWVVSDTVLYALGRAAAYAAVALLIRALSLQLAKIANPLLTIAEYALGPILILVGLVILDVIPLNIGSWKLQERVMAGAGKLPLVSSFLLGVGFALAFCPFSAALYFGGLIPLTIQSQSGILLAVVYGVGTALPVLGVGLLLAFSLQLAQKVISGLQRLDRWTRPATAIVFIAIGIYEIGLLVSSRL